MLRIAFQVTYHVDPQRLSKIPDPTKREKVKQVEEQGLAQMPQGPLTIILKLMHSKNG